MGLSWVLHGLPVEKHHELSIGFTWIAIGLTLSYCPRVSHGFPMFCPSVARGLSTGWPRIGHELNHGLLMRCPRVINRFPASLSRVAHGLPMGCPRVAHRLPTGCPRNTRGEPFHGLSMGCSWVAYERRRNSSCIISSSADRRAQRINVHTTDRSDPYS